MARLDFSRPQPPLPGKLPVMDTTITDEQKKEIRDVLENLTTVYTDTVSKIWEEVGLSDPPIKDIKSE